MAAPQRPAAALILALAGAVLLLGSFGRPDSPAGQEELAAAVDVVAPSATPGAAVDGLDWNDPPSLHRERLPPPTTSPYAPRTERPTRIAIPSLGIGLAIVVPAARERFPLCNVAEIEPRYGLDLDPAGVTFLYAHARQGMFWPLLAEVRANRTRDLLGREVEVWTDALRLHRYRITAVHPHQRTFALPDRASGEQLWLQTSETGQASGPKLFVVASPTGSGPASAAESLPKPKPVVCS